MSDSPELLNVRFDVSPKEKTEEEKESADIGGNAGNNLSAGRHGQHGEPLEGESRRVGGCISIAGIGIVPSGSRCACGPASLPQNVPL